MSMPRRMQEVSDLTQQGNNISEIAVIMKITESTVRYYLRQIVNRGKLYRSLRRAS